MELVDANELIPTEPSVVRTSVAFFINQLKNTQDKATPPIKVLKVDDLALVIDGHNRAYAFIKMGYTKIPCELLSVDTLPAYRQKYFSDFRKYILPARIANGEFKGSTPQVIVEVIVEVGRLLPLCMVPKTRKELLDLLDLKDREHFRKVYLVPALEGGYIERTIPDKPQSSKQKYRLTEKGKKWLEEKRG